MCLRIDEPLRQEDDGEEGGSIDGDRGGSGFSKRLAGTGAGRDSFFFWMVESVRLALKRPGADADWPGRSARPGLLLQRTSHAHACVYTSFQVSSKCVRCSCVSSM